MEIGLLAFGFAMCCGIITLIGTAMPQKKPVQHEKKVRYPYPREL